MPHPFSLIRPDAVTDMESAEQYIKQRVGIAYVTVKDSAIFRRKVKELFEHYPGADWQTLVRATEWAKTRRKRFSRLHQFVEAIRFAYEDGYLPELDPNYQGDVDEQIQGILREEEDPNWRRRLLIAQGMQAKQLAVEQWYEVRARESV